MNNLEDGKKLIPKYHYDSIKNESEEFINLTIEYYKQINKMTKMVIYII